MFRSGNNNCRRFRDIDIFRNLEYRGFGRMRGRRRHHFGKEMENRQRMKRGDIKYILLSLLEEESQHGYQLIKELESRWGGFYKPSPGSVYPTLQLLQEGGYLTSQEVEGKKVYTITDSGKDLLSENQDSVDAMNQFEMQPQLMELRTMFKDLRELTRQVARSGNTEKINRILDRFKQLKREIHLILAEEEENLD